MDSRLLIISSAVIMGIPSAALSFLPDKIAKLLQATQQSWTLLILQILGAQYLVFCMLNWMAKDTIGGIWSRSVSMGNFIMHFVISALTLIKSSSDAKGIFYWGVMAVYLIFAFCFGYIFFTHPLKSPKPSSRPKSI